MNLNEWALYWGIPYPAIEDLRRRFQMINTDPAPPSPDINNEANIQATIRLEASRKGLRLWRNNVGATMDERGNFIRFGLANDSKKMNEIIKSSDLIGIKPLNVGGRTLGQFVAREVKAPGWQYSGTKREVAQLKFLELVASFGGDAAFATDEGTL